MVSDFIINFMGLTLETMDAYDNFNDALFDRSDARIKVHNVSIIIMSCSQNMITINSNQ